MPYKQDSLIVELSKANKNLIVVNISGTAVEMPWVDKVSTIIQDWYLGSEAGNSLAQILSGDVNPSGKLPFTWPRKLEDVPAHLLDAYTDKEEFYKEDIFVGYRWADKEKDTKPLFPFGHGLSYTTFKYSKPVANKKVITPSDSVIVSVMIRNTGQVTGQEIVQLYISDCKSSLPRPVKELKGFKKVNLKPGEERTISFTIKKEALCYYDDKQHQWVAEPGKFEALVASSSQNIQGRVSFELK